MKFQYSAFNGLLQVLGEKHSSEIPGGRREAGVVADPGFF